MASFNDTARGLIGRLFGAHQTVGSRLLQYETQVDDILYHDFELAGLQYPPTSAKLVFFKDARTLALYGSEDGQSWHLVKKFEVFAASGNTGPKLREGDRQVPEGMYRIDSLNPNSLYHLSLRLNYPNEFDKQMALADGRKDLGSDIMIHGRSSSIGRIAIGDTNIEQLFVLAAKTNYRDWKVIIAPTDLRMNPRPIIPGEVKWLKELDMMILAELNELPKQEP